MIMVIKTNKTVKENPILINLFIDFILYKKYKKIEYGIIDAANKPVLSNLDKKSRNLKKKSFIGLCSFIYCKSSYC